MGINIIYFGLPGRAEVARLLLTVGKVDFVDERIERDAWAEMKPSVPFGQLPVAEVDGKYLAQSAAIDRYCAKVAGLLPDDPWAAALADQAYFFVDDVMKLFYPSFAIKDPEEKIKARQVIVEGPLKEKFTLLSKLLESRTGAFVAGDKVSHGDLALFCMLSTLQSGWLDGVPKDLLKDYPDLKAYRNSVAALDAVAAFYAKETDDIRAGFKPDV